MTWFGTFREKSEKIWSDPVFGGGKENLSGILTLLNPWGGHMACASVRRIKTENQKTR